MYINKTLLSVKRFQLVHRNLRKRSRKRLHNRERLYIFESEPKRSSITTLK